MEKTVLVNQAGDLLKPGASAWLAVLIACTCSFMVVFDGAVVNLALPAMQQQLALSELAQQWVVDAYLLVLGGLLLVSARASDWFGRGRVLSWGIVLFTLASAWAGMAESAASLLGARALQGVGASALASSTLAIIVTVHSDTEAKARAISIWAASSSLAVAIGVVVGGLLTSYLGWRAVMWLNLPIGVGLWLAVQQCLQTGAKKNKTKQRLDWLGSLSITLAMASTLWFLNQLQMARTAGWQVTMYGLLSLCSWLVFVLLERRQPDPVVPLHLFRLPAVSRGNFVVLGMGAMLTGSHYFISHYLQWQLQQTAWGAAISMLPLPLSLAVAAMLARYAMNRGWQHLPFYGGLIAALGLFVLCLYSSSVARASASLFNGALLLIGLGLGMMLMTATHTALALLNKEVAGLAAGLFNSARQLGAALGIAVLSLILHHQAGQADYVWVFAAAAGWMILVALAARGLAPAQAH